MNRRLYFLFPDTTAARAVVADLESMGIPRGQLHALAEGPALPPDMPTASDPQRHDRGRLLERRLWTANLALFGLALALLLVVLFTTRATWGLLPLVLVVATLAAGIRFTHVPDTHLDEFRDALAHGEILLMVDVPRTQVADIEERVHRRHPEATVGGVGWSSGALQV